MGLFGGGAPQTYSQGGNPATYVPTAQPQMDTRYQQILNSFPTTPQATPAGQYYPEAQQFYNTWLNPTGNAGGAAASLAQTGAQNAYNIGTAAAPQLAAGGQQILAAGFDPQQALYNRTLGQTLDAASVANAMAGIGGTPYGASNIANTANNFNIDWQNNLLNRMISGGQAGGALSQGAADLMAGASSLPYGVAQQIGQGGLQNAATVAQFGNAQYALPQQLAQDLQSYLQLGQSASEAAVGAGNYGFNQTAAGIGGLLSGANSLFGGNGLFSGGGLFGGGASALGGAGGLSLDAAGNLVPASLGAAGEATAYPIATGGGGFLSSILPTSG